jgi:putative MATE family efflux protein
MLDIHQSRRFLLFYISWPIFIELFLYIFMRSADIFMLSYVSDEAVGAVGIASQIIYFAFMINSMISAGSAIITAQYLGAGKQQKVIGLASNAIAFSFLFGIVLCMAILLNREVIIGWFLHDTALFNMAETYILILGSAISLQAVTMTMSAIIQAHGYTRQTMYIHTSVILMSLFGNYLFIYGAFGFPQLGVTGVAISGVFSQFCGFLATSVLLFKKVGVTLNWRAFFIWDRDHLRKIMGIGVPSAAEHISYTGIQLVTTIFITTLGITTLTAKIYTQNVMAFIFVFMMAIGKGTQIIIGHQVGAGVVERAYKQAFRSLYSAVAIAIVMVTVTSLWGKSLLSLYTKDNNILTVGATLLLFGFILEPGRSLNIVIGHALRAAGDARFMVGVSLLSMWCLGIPAAYYWGIHLGWGLYGIWMAYIVDEWARGLTLLWRWRTRKWEQKKLIDESIDKKEAAAIHV